MLVSTVHSTSIDEHVLSNPPVITTRLTTQQAKTAAAAKATHHHHHHNRQMQHLLQGGSYTRTYLRNHKGFGAVVHKSLHHKQVLYVIGSGLELPLNSLDICSSSHRESHRPHCSDNRRWVGKATRTNRQTQTDTDRHKTQTEGTTCMTGNLVRSKLDRHAVAEKAMNRFVSLVLGQTHWCVSFAIHGEQVGSVMQQQLYLHTRVH